MLASVMLKGLFTSSSLDIANPLISFLKDRRQSHRLAFTCGCHHPLNVGLILDLHRSSPLRSNFRQEPEITGFYTRDTSTPPAILIMEILPQLIENHLKSDP
jgi:hypothetical protein